MGQKLRFLKELGTCTKLLVSIYAFSVLFASTVFCCLLLAFCFPHSVSSRHRRLFNTHCWRNRTHQWRLCNSPSPTNPRLCRLSPTHTRSQVKTAYQSQTLQALTYSYPEPGKDQQCCKPFAELLGQSGVEFRQLRKIIRPLRPIFWRRFGLRKQTIFSCWFLIS